MLTLTGMQKKRMIEVLLEAFPTLSALQEIATFRLDVALDTVAGGENRRAVVFAFTEWASAQGRLDELLRGAHEENPGNGNLTAFCQEAGVLDAPASDAGQDQATTLRVLRRADERGELGALLVEALGGGTTSASRTTIVSATPAPTPTEAAVGPEGVRAPAQESEVEAGVRVRVLAELYDDIRAAMPASGTRTTLMEWIAGRLRAMATVTRPMVARLAESPRPGERLAAVMALQEFPDVKRVDWLADQVRTQKPFVGYHASLALRSAARGLPEGAREQAREAVERAMAAAGPSGALTERRKVLEDAKAALAPG